MGWGWHCRVKSTIGFHNLNPDQLSDWVWVRLLTWTHFNGGLDFGSGSMLSPNWLKTKAVYLAAATKVAGREYRSHEEMRGGVAWWCSDGEKITSVGWRSRGGGVMVLVVSWAWNQGGSGERTWSGSLQWNQGDSQWDEGSWWDQCFKCRILGKCRMS